MIYTSVSQDMGVRCIEVESSSRSSSGAPVYDAECARTAVDEVLSSVA